jgi:hypothetical protein
MSTFFEQWHPIELGVRPMLRTAGLILDFFFFIYVLINMGGIDVAHN